MSLAKYNARDVAKDFGMQAKEITGILTQYTKEAVSPTKVLTERELTIIFEHLTQHNQVESIATIYADTYTEAKKESAPAAAKPAEKKENAPTSAPKGAPAAGKPVEKKPSAPQQPVSRTPEKKVVDTRKGGNVNLEKYDQRLEDLAPEKADRMQTGKQKFQNRGNKGKQNFGNKRKQEEAEKLRKLQLEIAKKTPLTVKIPDEIAVGELASRMKKTGAEVALYFLFLRQIKRLHFHV